MLSITFHSRSFHLAMCIKISYVSHVLPQCNVCHYHQQLLNKYLMFPLFASMQCMPSSSGVAKTFAHLHCCPSNHGTTLQARKLLFFVLLFLFLCILNFSAHFPHEHRLKRSMSMKLYHQNPFKN